MRKHGKQSRPLPRLSTAANKLQKHIWPRRWRTAVEQTSIPAQKEMTMEISLNAIPTSATTIIGITHLSSGAGFNPSGYRRLLKRSAFGNRHFWRSATQSAWPADASAIGGNASASRISPCCSRAAEPAVQNVRISGRWKRWWSIWPGMRSFMFCNCGWVLRRRKTKKSPPPLSILPPPGLAFSFLWYSRVHSAAFPSRSYMLFITSEPSYIPVFNQSPWFPLLDAVTFNISSPVNTKFNIASYWLPQIILDWTELVVYVFAILYNPYHNLVSPSLVSALAGLPPIFDVILCFSTPISYLAT